jgi:hypothetical protein
MECEEEGKITVRMIPELTNIPKWKDRGRNTMSKHFWDFETLLSQHYGVERFPLDWVVRPNLPVISWGSIMNACAHNEGRKPDFFCFQETDYMCHNFKHIVPCKDPMHLVCDDPKVHVEWEIGACSGHRSKTFHQDDAIVLHCKPKTPVFLPYTREQTECKVGIHEI